jgi:hypothetical protein
MLQEEVRESEDERTNSPYNLLNICEVTKETWTPVVIQGNIDEVNSEFLINAIENGNCSEKSETSICDLPTEMLLEIFKHLRPRELCTSVAPVCKQWYNLSRDLCFRKKSKFCIYKITTEKAREFLRAMPLLRSLTLICRTDTNAILRELTHSCQYLEKLYIVSSKGSRTVRRISTFAISQVIKRATKLHALVFRDTYMRESHFYHLLQEHGKNVDIFIY